MDTKVQSSCNEFFGLDIGTTALRLYQSKYYNNTGNRSVIEFYDRRFPVGDANVLAVSENQVKCCCDVPKEYNSKNVVRNIRLLTGKELKEKDWEGQLGMDYEIKQVEIENRKWLQVGLVFNKKMIYYLYPEYIQKLILDRCLTIVKDSKGEIPPDHMCFNIPCNWNEDEILSFRITMKLIGHEESRLCRDHVAAAYHLCQWVHNSFLDSELQADTSNELILCIGHSYAFAIRCHFSMMGENENKTVKRTKCEIDRCVTTESISGLKISKLFFDYLCNHIDNETVKEQFRKDYQFRHRFFPLFIQQKSFFCGDSHTADEISLEDFSMLHDCDVIENISDDEFGQICEKRLGGHVTELLKEVAKEEKIDKINICGGSTCAAFIMREVNAFARERNIQISKVMNSSNAIAEGLVIDSMRDKLEGANDYTVIHDCSIYNMDNKTYHDDQCYRSVCYTDTFQKIYQTIKEEGDKVLQKAKEAVDKQQNNLAKYSSLCDEIKQLLEQHPEVNDQVGDEYFLMSRIKNMRGYYKNTQFLEQNLQNLEEYKTRIEECIKHKGRMIVPLHVPIRK